MKSSVPCFLGALLCVPIIGLCSAADVAAWSAKDGFSGVGNVEGAALSRTDDALVLAIDQPDCKLFLKPSVPFETENAERLEIKYRASGTGPFGGQFYYARATERFSDSRCWKLPPLKADGQWHVMAVSVDSLSDKADWFAEGSIVSCRYDPTDSPGGRLEVAEIRITGGDSAVSGRPPYHGDGGGVRALRPTDEAARAKYDADLWPDVKSEVWSGEAREDTRPPVEVRSLGGTASPAAVRAGSSSRIRSQGSGRNAVLPKGVTAMRCRCRSFPPGASFFGRSRPARRLA